MSYSTSHPWYYVLGGTVPYPREIITAVKEGGYRGYREAEILCIDGKAEPSCTHLLWEIRQEVCQQLQKDGRRYRQVALALHRYRLANPIPDKPVCADVHVNLSLKYAHLFNGFAHLLFLDELLSRQPDLFGI